MTLKWSNMTPTSNQL